MPSSSTSTGSSSTAKRRCSASGRSFNEQHGGRLTLDLWQTAIGTHHGFDPCAELQRQTGVVLPRERWMEHVRVEHWSRCEAEPLQPGVRALEEARQSGIGTAVASSSSRTWVGPWLTRHGLRAARAANMWAVAVPRSLTRALPMPEPDAVIESLDACTLTELRRTWIVRGRSARAWPDVGSPPMLPAPAAAAPDRQRTGAEATAT